MKKLLLAGLAVAAFVGTAEANVSVRPYVSAKASYSKMDLDTHIDTEKLAKKDWVWGGSAAVGLKMCAFRTEFEFNQSATAKDTRAIYEADPLRSQQSYRSYMLNGYFDIPTYTPVHPYVGAGIGLARIKSRLTNVDAGETIKHKETNLGYQVMAGIGYNLTKNWTLDVGYRYVDNGSSSWKIATASSQFKLDTTEHQITAGIRYTF